MKLKNSLALVSSLFILAGCQPADHETPPDPSPLVSWPKDEVQSYTKSVTGFDVEIPAYNLAYKIELDTTEMVTQGYFGIYCSSERDQNPEATYTNILKGAGWEVESEKVENFYNAYDPEYKVWMNFEFNSEYNDLEIFITQCTKTKWPEKDINDALQIIAPGTKTKIPEFEAYTIVANYYPQYRVLAINAMGYDDKIINNYTDILEKENWVVSFDDTIDEYVGISPNKDIKIQFYIETDKSIFNVDVFSYTPPVENWPYEQIAAAVEKVFDCTPAGIVKTLNLKQPIYRKTASYGHFGRPEFPWEKTDKVEALKKTITK